MKGPSLSPLAALVPTGTARSWFLGTAAPDDPEDALPRELRALLGAHDVSGETLWAAWEVTTWAAGAPSPDRRALGCLVVGLLQEIDAGGTFLPLGPDGTRAPAAGGPHPLEEALRALGIGQADRQLAHTLASRLIDGTAAPQIAALVGAPGTRRPFILADGALYPERFWCLEERLTSLLRARQDQAPPPLGGSIADSINAVNATPGAIRLAEEQIQAVHAALTNSLTVIAGGPGSGKTSTIVGLLRTLVRLGVAPDQIALGAPTGRAASRMKESVDAALARLEVMAAPDAELAAGLGGATTLHRLLGIRSGRTRALEPGAPEFYADWPLPHRIVIVDEASMIDLVMMDQLVSAVGPAARLVLIGDANQLPSVQVGAVFRDLVAGLRPGATRRLTRSHRMSPIDPDGAEILRVATSVNAGTADLTGTPLCARAVDLTFHGFERLGPGTLDEFLDRWHREILAPRANLPLAFDRLYRVDGNANGEGQGEDESQSASDAAGVRRLLETILAARILCLTRQAGRFSSAAAINRLMHHRAQADAVARGLGESVHTAPFIPGEPVMVLRNDHARGLSNGDVGVVLRVRASERESLGVAFAHGARYVVHALDAISGDLTLAFALTVHKAQGSEYERAALVLPDTDGPLLTREVLYTALTRARRGVVVLGDPALFSLAATRTLTRTSGIARGLAARAVPRST